MQDQHHPSRMKMPAEKKLTICRGLFLKLASHIQACLHVIFYVKCVIYFWIWQHYFFIIICLMIFLLKKNLKSLTSFKQKILNGKTNWSYSSLILQRYVNIINTIYFFRSRLEFIHRNYVHCNSLRDSKFFCPFVEYSFFLEKATAIKIKKKICCKFVNFSIKLQLLTILTVEIPVPK